MASEWQSAEPTATEISALPYILLRWLGVYSANRAKADSTKTLSTKQAIAIDCPTCGAAPGERYTPVSGEFRTRPHRDSRLIAADPSSSSTDRKITSWLPEGRMRIELTNPH